jgi:outer membrane biosynthesis protein TonB
VPVEDGEFVVVTNQDQAFVLPRASKFATRRDFYEFYQDYYHCPNPDAGDVQILQPAFVKLGDNGWSLVATGTLDVIREQQPKKKPVVAPVVKPTPPVQTAPPPPTPAPTPKREEPEPAPPPVIAAAKKETRGVKTCTECGSQIEEKYFFCWKCGHSMSNEQKPRQILSSAIDLDDELTLQHEPRPHNSTVLPWSTSRAPEHPSSSRGSVLKLLAIGGVAFVLLSLGAFGLFRSGTETASATAAPPSEAPQQVSQPAGQPQPTAPITTEVSRNAPAETTTQQVTPNPEDELKKLRERRMSAPASERPKVFQAFAKVEKQYPRDYRFPYERAKFAAKGSKSGSQSEAFRALNAAAQKAISTGKANEMLNGLETDKSGDFSRISQGRFEWSRLVAALKRKDTSLLGE